jgi:signal transduction histidine kinase
MKATIFRPLRLATFGFVLMSVAFVLVISLMTWRQYQRVLHGRSRIHHVQVFQRAFLKLADAAIDDRGAASPGESENLDELLAEVDDLIGLAEFLDADTPRKLRELRTLLRSPDSGSGETLPQALMLFRDIVSGEAVNQERLLTDMETRTLAELQLTVAAILVLLGLGVVILLFVRLRILRPLRGLEFLVSRLAQGEFTPVPITQADPLLHRLFNNYNRLVMRLEELEQEHRTRAESLEREVRMATAALLEQQRGLARAERLAATGELAATVAHELRNPLAGIQATLGNLMREVDDADMVQRLELATGELKRLSRLLDGLLDMGRHAPEPLRELDLAASVRQLLVLTRYQLPDRVRLESSMPDGLICRLPEDRLRQALLNLILNAARALDDKPGVIEVSAEAEGKRLRITVSDDGPGFPPDMVRRTPRPFFSTGERGTGLGLTVVHRLVRDLGGDLELSNREPHGARVILTLHDCVKHG